MRYSLRIFSGCALCASLLLAGCLNDNAPVNGPAEALAPMQRFPITLEAHMAAFRLSYDTARNDLEERSQAELERIARDYLENGSGAIAISASRNLPDASARTADRLAALGVQRNRILAGTDNGMNPGGEVKVSYIRYQADAEECGDWSENLGVTYTNKPSPNLGCATQHNIAAMIADPRDLALPKAEDSADAQRRLTVLDKYRKGESTPSQKAGEQSGAISTVGMK
jgi:pilus assembly protein CpaD